MRRFDRTILLPAVLCLTVWTVQHGQDSQSLTRPLTQYTIGDLFPSVDARLVETAESWKVASADLRALATSREESVAQGLNVVEQRIGEHKAEAKAAKKSKDFTSEGSARGAIETEEAVQDILTRMGKLSAGQRKVADAWFLTSEAMSSYVAADEVFDPYRSRGIAKPSDRGYDNRIEPAGVDAFRSQTKALDELGKRFERLGSEIQSLVDQRMEVLSQLEKGGHVQTPPMPSR